MHCNVAFEIIYRVSQKKVLFRNVAVLLLRGVWAVKIWVFLGAEHIYTITRCLAHVTNVSTLMWVPISPIYTFEWLFDQKFCYYPKEDFFWGHPVVVMSLSGLKPLCLCFSQYSIVNRISSFYIFLEPCNDKNNKLCSQQFGISQGAWNVNGWDGENGRFKERRRMQLSNFNC